MPPDSPICRPAFAVWLYARGISREQAAGALDLSPITVQRYCLPFDNDDRRIPPPAVLERIVDWTGGEITPADFYPPHLSGAKSDAEAVA